MELCSLLVRNVTYEIPSLKKQIAKCQQLQQDYSRKEEEGQAGAAEMREQFYHSCKQYGITVSTRALVTVGGNLGPLSSWAQHLCIWERLPSPSGCVLLGPVSLLSSVVLCFFLCFFF